MKPTNREMSLIPVALAVTVVVAVGGYVKNAQSHALDPAPLHLRRRSYIRPIVLARGTGDSARAFSAAMRFGKALDPGSPFAACWIVYKTSLDATGKKLRATQQLFHAVDERGRRYPIQNGCSREECAVLVEQQYWEPPKKLTIVSDSPNLQGHKWEFTSLPVHRRILPKKDDTAQLRKDFPSCAPQPVLTVNASARTAVLVLRGAITGKLNDSTRFSSSIRRHTFGYVITSNMGEAPLFAELANHVDSIEIEVASSYQAPRQEKEVKLPPMTSSMATVALELEPGVNLMAQLSKVPHQKQLRLWLRSDNKSVSASLYSCVVEGVSDSRATPPAFAQPSATFQGASSDVSLSFGIKVFPLKPEMEQAIAKGQVVRVSYDKTQWLPSKFYILPVKRVISDAAP
jgi:hypothetical protein